MRRCRLAVLQRLSSRSFAFGCHARSPFLPLFWVRLFLYLFFHDRRPRPRAGPRRGAVGGFGLEVRVEVRRTEGHPPHPFFVNRGHCIGMRSIAKAPASSTLLILIQEIQPSP